MGSPESVTEKRRGRLGMSTGRFLGRARSPPATISRSVSSGILTNTSLVGSLNTANTAATSTAATSVTTPTQTSQSLRSKDSTISMGAPSSGSLSSDTGSVSGERVPSIPTVNGKGEKRLPEEKEHEGGKKLKKMKKYKEGAEKVLSLFGSPRQERTQAAQS
ncbi:hypothetical protein M422DRAFT_241669 [Sphaerobolus stellatus SS14]|nr:hypothetical protein M422DRAFT_241669 [Sphaerobolus stellatus SS14]